MFGPVEEPYTGKSGSALLQFCSVQKGRAGVSQLGFSVGSLPMGSPACSLPAKATVLTAKCFPVFRVLLNNNS